MNKMPKVTEVSKLTEVNKVNKKSLKIISIFASLLSLALVAFLLLAMPNAPKVNIKEAEELDLSAFYLDASALDLGEIYISSIAKHKGKFYIADALAKRVYCVDENSKIIWESSGEDKFILPNLKFPLSISEDGNLWVSNTGRHQLEQLDLETGKFIASWQPKDSFKGCCNPVAILALDKGEFFAMEKGTKLLKLFSPDGSAKDIAKLNDKWQNYELKIEGNKLIYCDGLEIKEIFIKDR